MPTVTNAFAVLGIALAVYAAGVQAIFKRSARFTPRATHLLGSLLVLAVLLVPFSGQTSFVTYIRGVSSDLSITSVALSVWSLCSRFGYFKSAEKQELTALMTAVAIAALILYPTALGWGNWDAYRLGWGSWWFLCVLFVVCSINFWMGLRVLPALISLSLLAWSFGLLESGNLWDYLIDPWLSVFAVVSIFIKYSQVVFKRFTNRSFR